MLRTKPLSRFATYASFGVLFLLVGFYFRDANIVRKQIHKIHDPATAFAKLYPKKETLRSRALTDDQCRKTFPGLSKEVEDSVARGPFFLKRLTGYTPGIVQGRILDGKVNLTPIRECLHWYGILGLTTELVVYNLCGWRCAKRCPTCEFWFPVLWSARVLSFITR
jgi:hypothetical protein